MDSDYKEFIKAMIYIEKNIKDELVLEKLGCIIYSLIELE